jgi:hypothetical protein
MCWVLYLAADRPLSLRPFEADSPGFNVAPLSEHESVVRGQFSKPFVYALGAHTRCGCGFDRGQANPAHPEELAATEASLAGLRHYLDAALASAGSLELYACWYGDQAAEPDQRLQRRLEQFTPGMSWFPDRTFVTVEE